MNILTVIIVLVVVGVVMYLINEYIPMAPNIKKILNIAIVIFVIVWLLKVLGAWAYLSSLNV